MTDYEKKIKEGIDGIINTYFVSVLLRRPDMVKFAKDDLMTLFFQIIEEKTQEIMKLKTMVEE